ncbi:hypothetical protein LCER1_G001777 [Lachnellula cervina]|uniref:Uncharacterized protein n=1 Tax=Lachnellula cervina TaxID=1316786 RepID=A0A7D8UST8_9HELO|nr:hypothetical protein LCER1_G001777 [Lachnellula cervina]
MNPTQKSPERAFALQKYLLLHAQHDALQKHLSQITTSLPEPASSSPEPSPDRYRQGSDSQGSISSSAGSDSSSLSSSPPNHPRHHHRSGSIPFPPTQRPVLRTRRSSLPTVITENLLDEIEKMR